MSNRQFEANKRNAGKSTGPNTPEGKAVSSQNARTHGFTASTVVLSTEDSALYEHRREQFHAALKPVGLIETDLVDEITCARWRQQRCIVFETAIIDRKIDEQAKYLDEKFDVLDVETRGALAQTNIANSSKSRRDASLYEYRHRRTYEKAMKELQDLQKLRAQTQQTEPPTTPMQKVKIKPIPNNEHREITPISLPKPAPTTPQTTEIEDLWPKAA
jgi:hypothetical protein